MGTYTKWLGVAILALMAALALTVCPALAQRGAAVPRLPPAAPGAHLMGPSPFQAPGMGTFNPGSQAFNLGLNPPLTASLSSLPAAALNPYSGGAMTSINPYGASSSNSPGLNGTSAYGSGSPYGANYYYPDPYGGGLQGAAAAISAQGDYEQAHARSRTLNQAVEQEKVNTQHRIIEEWLYERALTPTLQQQQEATLALELRRALRNPQTQEIISGYALDLILDDLKAKLSQGERGQATSIDPAVLKQINVTTKASGGSLGVLRPLKEGQPLQWPLALQSRAYQDEVRRINQKASDAVKLVQSTGQVDAATLNDLRDDVDRVRARVRNYINDLSPSQVIAAIRYLNQLDSALRALRQPDASKYILDQFAAKGKTVPELIDHMASNGLRFAPAADGDETAYLALHNYLTAFDHSLQPATPPSSSK